VIRLECSWIYGLGASVGGEATRIAIGGMKTSGNAGISYLSTREGWLYMAVIIDLH
jgi:hypothetical protein